VEVGGYGEGAAQDSDVYHRARPTRVPSALPKAQIALVKHEVVERFGA
jgi:hypothetical protein